MKILANVFFSGLILASASVVAEGSTSINSNWICTTNASASSVESDITADKQMSEKATSAADAYAFASLHCRDCTKITCSVKD